MTPRDILKTAKKIGISWVSITDHNTVRGSLTAMREQGAGVKVIPGIEVSSSDGHLLGYGIKEDIPRGLSLDETIEKIHDLGGIVSVAHPGRFWSGVKPEKALRVNTDLIEVLNSRSSRRCNDVARTIADTRNLPGTAGSDAHSLDEVGRGYLILEQDAETPDQLLHIILKNGGKPSGQSRSVTGSFRYAAKCVSEWVARGFHRI